MNKTEFFANLFENTSVDVSLSNFVINLVIAAILSALLSWVYINWSSAIASRKRFARNFVLLTMTTMFIITVVKSSLALSLGLVGALSIVRFRTAIKETEELIFLFIAISIGLGLGADQRLLTITAFILITIIIWLRKHKTAALEENLYLTINSSNKEINANEILNIVKKYSDKVDLKRFDNGENGLFLSVFISVTEFETLEKIQKDLKSNFSEISFSFLDSKTLL